MGVSSSLAYAICNGYFDLNGCPIPEEAGVTSWDKLSQNAERELFLPYHTRIMDWWFDNSAKIREKVAHLYRYASKFGTTARMQISTPYLFYFSYHFPEKLPAQYEWAAEASKDVGDEYAKDDRDSFASWIQVSNELAFESAVDSYISKVPSSLAEQVPESPYLAAKVAYVIENPSILQAVREVSDVVASKNYTPEEASVKTLPALPKFVRAFKDKAAVKLLSFLKREDSLQPETPEEEAGCKEVKGFKSIVRSLFPVKQKVDIMDMLSYSVMQNLIATGAVDKNKVDPEALKATIEEVLNPKKTTGAPKVNWSTADQAIKNLEEKKVTYATDTAVQATSDIFEKSVPAQPPTPETKNAGWSIKSKCLALGVLSAVVNFLTMNNIFIYIFAALCVVIGVVVGRSKK